MITGWRPAPLPYVSRHAQYLSQAAATLPAAPAGAPAAPSAPGAGAGAAGRMIPAWATVGLGAALIGAGVWSGLTASGRNGSKTAGMAATAGCVIGGLYMGARGLGARV